jgi:tetratricopeptide (TPR) repeat protein
MEGQSSVMEKSILHIITLIDQCINVLTTLQPSTTISSTSEFSIPLSVSTPVSCTTVDGILQMAYTICRMYYENHDDFVNDTLSPQYINESSLPCVIITMYTLSQRLVQLSSWCTRIIMAPQTMRRLSCITLRCALYASSHSTRTIDNNHGESDRVIGNGLLTLMALMTHTVASKGASPDSIPFDWIHQYNSSSSGDDDDKNGDDDVEGLLLTTLTSIASQTLRHLHSTPASSSPIKVEDAASPSSRLIVNAIALLVSSIANRVQPRGLVSEDDDSDDDTEEEWHDLYSSLLMLLSMSPRLVSMIHDDDYRKINAITMFSTIADDTLSKLTLNTLIVEKELVLSSGLSPSIISAAQMRSLQHCDTVINAFHQWWRVCGYRSSVVSSSLAQLLIDISCQLFQRTSIALKLDDHQWPPLQWSTRLSSSLPSLLSRCRVGVIELTVYNWCVGNQSNHIRPSPLLLNGGHEMCMSDQWKDKEWLFIVDELCYNNQWYDAILYLRCLSHWYALNGWIWHRLSWAYHYHADTTASVRSLARACHISADNPHYWTTFALLVYKHQSKHQLTIDLLRRLLNDHDAHRLSFDSWMALATSLCSLSRFDDALNVMNDILHSGHHSSSIATSALYHYNMADILSKLHRYNDAISYGISCVNIDHRFLLAYGGIISWSVTICDFDAFNLWVTRLRSVATDIALNDTKQHQLLTTSLSSSSSSSVVISSERVDDVMASAFLPFQSLTIDLSIPVAVAIARHASMDYINGTKRMIHHTSALHNNGQGRRHGESDGNKIIRMGYLCSDFKNHCTGDLLLTLFTKLDRHHFIVYAYSNLTTMEHDDHTRRIKSSVDHWEDVASLDDHQLWSLIHDQHQIDILIDLNGYTIGHRLGTLAMRAAPLQISWLGYPGTTGASFIDYIVVDAIIATHDNRHSFTESLIKMTYCYQVNSYRDCHTHLAVSTTSAQAPSIPQLLLHTSSDINTSTKKRPHIDHDSTTVQTSNGIKVARVTSTYDDATAPNDVKSFIGVVQENDEKRMVTVETKKDPFIFCNFNRLSKADEASLTAWLVGTLHVRFPW